MMKVFYKCIETNDYVEAFKEFDSTINSSKHTIADFLEGFKNSSKEIQEKMINIVKGFIELQKENYKNGWYDGRNEFEIRKCLEYNFENNPKIISIYDYNEFIYENFLKKESIEKEKFTEENETKAVKDMNKYERSDNAFISQMVLKLLQNHRTLNAYTCMWFFRLIEENNSLFV